MYTCYGGENVCLEGNITTDPKGNCAEGYKGILCSICDEKYSKLGDFICSQCPNNYWSKGFILLVYFIIYISLIVLIIKTVNNPKTTYFSIFLKILLNHLQALSILKIFTFNWSSLQIFIDNIKPIVYLDSHLQIIDCFVKQTPNICKIILLIQFILLNM